MSKSTVTVKIEKTLVTGSPAECGGQIARQIFLPSVEAISKNIAMHENLHQFYVGALSSIYGMMLADFGVEKSEALILASAQIFTINAEKIEGVKTQ